MQMMPWATLMLCKLKDNKQSKSTCIHLSTQTSSTTPLTNGNETQHTSTDCHCLLTACLKHTANQIQTNNKSPEMISNSKHFHKQSSAETSASLNIKQTHQEKHIGNRTTIATKNIITNSE
jgi:hypothetical protein